MPKLVFTNGCFDLLHIGHIDLLRRAKQLGDKLIVGLNSDESVAHIKKGRPIIPCWQRVAVIDAIQWVDEVVVFHEDTPCALIEALRPNIHVKGGDWKAEDLPETPIVEKHGGEVVILDPVYGQSTTGIIKKIRRMT